MKEKEKKILKKAGIDIKSAMERFEDDEETYLMFLKKFTSDTNYKKLCEAVSVCDRETALTAAHTMKGVTANLSIVCMYQILVPLVDELRTHIISRDNIHFQKLQLVYHDVIKAID